ncbi:MAG: ANTAR domain-containing protein [Alphaproteobacteria bacterium]|nr:ANTAR domain-containing protein [Alphaproteobacteria bacterium]
MRPPSRIPNLGGAQVVILHRKHATGSAIVRQLSAIGAKAIECWPELSASAMSADFIIFDADQGYDEQFPWERGHAPMPIVALVGTEAPGRVEWVLNQNADTHLLKPVGNSGVYSALLIARAKFEQRMRLHGEIEDLRSRVGARQTIVKAVIILSARGFNEDDAYDQLRNLAMTWRMSIEDAARQITGHNNNEDDGNEFTDIA